MAYKLELPPSLRVHLVFHVSCLKKVIGDKIPVQTIFPKINEKGKIIQELETCLGVTKEMMYRGPHVAYMECQELY
jgi:hypothetical protein